MSAGRTRTQPPFSLSTSRPRQRRPSQQRAHSPPRGASCSQPCYGTSSTLAGRTRASDGKSALLVLVYGSGGGEGEEQEQRLHRGLVENHCACVWRGECMACGSVDRSDRDDVVRAVVLVQ